MEWFGLIVLLGILLKTMSQGGDWFDFAQANARYQNQKIHFEFTALFIVLGVAIFGGAIWLLVEVIKPDDPQSPPYQSNRVSPSMPVKTDKAAKRQTHRVHSKLKHKSSAVNHKVMNK